MKFLIDSCISKFAVGELRDKDHEVVWIPEEGTDPGDSEILNRALKENRILITADKDFGDLVFVFHKPHPAIIRLVNIRAKDQGKRILKVIEKYEQLLYKKVIFTIDKARVRIRESGE